MSSGTASRQGTDTPRADPVTGTDPGFLGSPATDRLRPLWLGIALVLQLLAVGGRWDLALAAWVFPVFLIRFARASRLPSALVGVWLVCAAGGAFWYVQLGVPFAPVPFVGILALATVISFAFMFDRLVHRWLPMPARLLAFAVALVSAEFFLGVYSPFGTAYGLTAVTQHADLGLLQVISITGPYGIAFLVGLVAAAVNHWWERGFTRAAARVPLVAVAIVVAVIAVGQARMAWLAPSGSTTVQVAGINPNATTIEDAMASVDVGSGDFEGVAGANRDALRTAFDTVNAELLADTAASAAAGAELVVWSELAARVLVEDEAAFVATLQDVASENDIYLNAAMSVVDEEPQDGKNQTVLVGPDGEVLWTYEKHHPIPGMEPFDAGTGDIPVVETPFGRIANVICYDADFPDLMHVDADIMIVPGFDWPEMGWIHTKMSSLRAIENGYTLVRQDFDGSSQAFDRHGNLLDIQDTTMSDPDTWFVELPVDSGKSTVYRVLGDAFSWLCVLGTAGLLVLTLTIRRNARRIADVTTSRSR